MRRLFPVFGQVLVVFAIGCCATAWGQQSKSFVGWQSSYDYVAFTPQSVVLSPGSTSQIYFLINRKDWTVHKVITNDPVKSIAGYVQPPPVSEQLQQYTGSTAAYSLYTSDNEWYKSIQGYCDEGEHEIHSLFLEDDSERHITDHIRPCLSVTAIERVGKDLWLGTYYMGEHGPESGQGIIVITHDGNKLVREITAKDGLSDDVIYAIRRDPFAKRVWVVSTNASELNPHIALYELDAGFHVLAHRYIHIVFDPVTHEPSIALTETPHRDDPFVLLEWNIGVQDHAAYYRAVMSIPGEMREKYSTQDFEFSGGPHFPKEFNVLLPFFEYSLLNNNTYEKYNSDAVRSICRFDDPTVKITVKQFIQRNPGALEFDQHFFEACDLHAQ